MAGFDEARGPYSNQITDGKTRERKDRGELLPTDSAAALPAAFFARFLVMRMLLQLAQKPALLQLQIEALQSAIDGLIRLDDDLNQIYASPWTSDNTRFSAARTPQWSP
jgi:hypothetical protein